MSVGKDDMVGDLVAVVPGVEEAVLGVVVYLGGVGIFVLKQQSRDNLRVGVGVEGIGDIGVPLVVTVHGVEHPADDKAVAVEIPPEPRAPRGLLVGAQVHGVELAQDDDFLAEAFFIQGWVDEPQAVLIHSKVHIRVALPPPGCGLLVGHVVEHGPGSHVALPQVVLDDVSGEGPVVVESAVVHHVTRADPAVGKLVGIAPATWGGEKVGSFRAALPCIGTRVCTPGLASWLYDSLVLYGILHAGCRAATAIPPAEWSRGPTLIYLTVICKLLRAMGKRGCLAVFLD